MDALVDITTGEGTLAATGGHRFWVQGRGWTPAEALHPGDALRNPSGGAVGVPAVSVGRRHAPSELVTNPDRALAIQWGRIEALSSGSGVDWRVIADRKNKLGTAWELYRLRTSYRLATRNGGT
ncbi:hypothetical protein [Microbispora catharanthi]|uniref:Hint domain-containing protein n=1 Tax=Microbispora catharanthi TaxID=1712871 RepID=A0A5N6C4F1_9ACTN|nr:hypothetical protein [Microbispora catharanthi]KAB8187676.1 hypothetical protein FH610_000405 [Microbispora catharanthi]